MVFWGTDWLVSAKLDLVHLSKPVKPGRSKSGRRSRAKRSAVDVNGDSHEYDEHAANGDVHEDEELEGDGEGEGEGDSVSIVSRHTRRRRAQQAREQLEALSLSPSIASSPFDSATPSLSLAGGGSGGGSQKSSLGDDDFVKVHDGFRGVCGVDWLGQGEMCVVERRFEDMRGELPVAFSVGGYGRS